MSSQQAEMVKTRSRPGQDPPRWNVWNFHCRRTSTAAAGVVDSAFGTDNLRDLVWDVVHGDPRLTLKLIQQCVLLGSPS